MWEDTNETHGVVDAARIHDVDHSRCEQVAHADISTLPVDLLILGRFGVQRTALQNAFRQAQIECVRPAEILIRENVISPAIWQSAQRMLKAELLNRNGAFRTAALSRAVHALHTEKPEFSSAQTIQWKQVFFIVILAGIVSTSFFTAQPTTLSILLFLLTLFYMSGVIFRTIMLSSFDDGKRPAANSLKCNANELPTYSVLVALYKEASQVKTLTDALMRLDWPENKLDIKLICEEDDRETIHAIRALNLPNCFQLIIAPDHQPKTKPKALNFALPLCDGEFLVLYDAEDIPSPGQLREAYSKFRSAGDDLACLQAPLHIHNANQNWLTRLFAIEYKTLFNGILPVLAKWQAPLPLGGTSNHFRLTALKEVGAWDPYNVTEDADLGIRLFRHGFKCDTITLPTFEECPPYLTPWLCQRTRWLKGWMQTILVHTRNPLRATRDMGAKNALIFNLFLTAIVISALIHPIFFYYSMHQVIELHHGIDSYLRASFVATNMFNLVGGYTTYGLMAYVVLIRTKSETLIPWLILLPFYWILISLAAWRALFFLIVQPHKWEKTPHGLSNHLNDDMFELERNQ